MKGILVDYEYCTGCQSCMMACQVEKGLELGKYGIVVNTIGPWAIDEQANAWQYDFVPVLTDECDLCASRVDKGKLPTCVFHCLAAVMEYGEVEELAKKTEKGKQIILIPKQ